MDKYKCTRCESALTENECKNNVCLCDMCRAILYLENYKNPYKWGGINNIDNILESKRGG